MKIFKYKNENGAARLPIGARVIRCDHVDDGFYKGDFVWAIVDENENENEIVDLAGFKNENEIETEPEVAVELRVKEKQKIKIRGVPTGVGEEDGKLFLYYSYDMDSMEEVEIEIAFYKTGQLIDLPIDKLHYLGLCRLWIVQELGLYTFLIE